MARLATPSAQSVAPPPAARPADCDGSAISPIAGATQPDGPFDRPPKSALTLIEPRLTDPPSVGRHLIPAPVPSRDDEWYLTMQVLSSYLHYRLPNPAEQPQMSTFFINDTNIY
jgi:hypothetical protein